MTELLELFALFASLSLVAFGGGDATLPAIERRVVGDHEWVSSATFVHLYALGQLAPGPSTMYVAGIGYVVHGVPGAIAAGVGFVLPSSILVVVAGSAWERWKVSPWKVALRDGLAPVTVGLLAAGAYRLALAERSQLDGAAIIVAAVLAVIVTACAVRGRVSPALLVIGAGVAGVVTLG